VRALFVWFRVAREHEAAVVSAVHELQARWSAQGLQCELLRRADDAPDEITLMEVYRAAGGVDATWQARIEDEAGACLAPWLAGPRHIEMFEPCA
jgi:Domain of unknown function (DUF4936)